MSIKKIIEFEEVPFVRRSNKDKDGDIIVERLFRAVGFDTLMFDSFGLAKLPNYVELNVKEIISEAFDNGYKKCLKEHDFSNKCSACRQYQNGKDEGYVHGKADGALLGYRNGYKGGLVNLHRAMSSMIGMISKAENEEDKVKILLFLLENTPEDIMNIYERIIK